MMGGTHGKILHVDLTSGDTCVEQPTDDLYQLLVGGRAVIAYLLLRDLPKGTDALSPDNLLIFAPGIMQGTSFPGAGRHAVGGKSPLTGALGSSEAGGWWGHEFKRAGFDALVVTGRAESPVYLWIHDGEVEIRPADHMWGKATAPVQVAIRDEVVGPDLLAVEYFGTPDTRKLESLRDVLVHEPRDIGDGIAAAHREGFFPVRRFPRCLRVNAHDLERLEQERPECIDAVSGFR